MNHHSNPSVVFRRSKKQKNKFSSDPPIKESPYLDREIMRKERSDAGRAENRQLVGKVPPRRSYKLVEGIDPAALFIAYHLGVTEDDQYKPQNLHDVARRFRVPPAVINQALREYEIDAETMLNTDFDLGMAQLDIKVAPAGISKKELALQLYEEFRSSPRIERNWEEEALRDAEENRKIYEKLK